MAASSWREPSPTLELKPVYCKACHRKLGNFDGKGTAEIACRRCGVLNTIRPH